VNDPSGHRDVSRRTVVCTAFAGLLTGCSGTPAAPQPGHQSTPPARDDSAAPADGTGTALAAVADVPVGGGVVTTSYDGPVLLLRPAADTVTAYRAGCPHAGVTVNAPAGGTVSCPAHGSRFSATDGHRIAGPAKTGLAALAVRVADGQVFLA
jgi:nitrite reductase/ring-hydroxylating ferredoxin subunit